MWGSENNNVGEDTIYQSRWQTNQNDGQTKVMMTILTWLGS